MVRWADRAGRDKEQSAVETIARVGVAMLVSVASASAQSFSHIITDTSALGQFSHVFVVADLNGDALDDIVVGGKVDHDPDFTPADRLTKVPLHIFVSNGDGTFTHAPELVDGQIEAHDAVVLSADFNGDERNDLVVYDHGAYVDSESSGYGNPPQFFVSCPDGVLRPFGVLEDAVRAQHQRQPPHLPPAAPADLHLKMATTGDLENDGDVDIWGRERRRQQHEQPLRGEQRGRLVHDRHPQPRAGSGSPQQSADVVAVPRGPVHGRRP